jgi:hypothetical protein
MAAPAVTARRIATIATKVVGMFSLLFLRGEAASAGLLP